MKSLLSAGLVVSLACAIAIPALAPAAAQSPDRVSRFGEYQGYSEPLYDEWVRVSQYVPVRDGTRLAVDIFRPAVGGTPVDDPLPVIWTFHRYHRARVDRAGKTDRVDHVDRGLDVVDVGKQHLPRHVLVPEVFRKPDALHGG